MLLGRGVGAFYKHAAPLGQGVGGASVLRTCCPAGAGGGGSERSTNMLPRWGRRLGGRAFYKHAAPLGQEAGGAIIAESCCHAGGRRVGGAAAGAFQARAAGPRRRTRDTVLTI